MEAHFLASLSDAHKDRIAHALAADAFYAPVHDVIHNEDRESVRVRYLHTTVGGLRYLPLFSDHTLFESLIADNPIPGCAGLVMPPLEVLRGSLGNLPVVVDLNSENPFTSTVFALADLRKISRR